MTKVITELFRVSVTQDVVKTFERDNESILDVYQNSVEEYNATESLGLSTDNISEFRSIANIALETDDRYYIFGSSLDAEGVVNNSWKSKKEFLRRVIFGNRITELEVKYLFNLNNYESNTVYDSFDDEEDIRDLNFYVTVLGGNAGEASYEVYVCIRNNNGGISTETPTNVSLDDNNEATLADGYTWKYLFDVPAAEYLDYSVGNLLPYFANNEIIANAKEEVSDIVIENAKFGEFADYIIGTANTTANNIDSVSILSVVVDNASANTYRVSINTSVSAKNSIGAYSNMYLYIPNPGTGNTIYEVLNSQVPTGVQDENILYVFVRDDNVDLTSIGLPSKACNIVPKIDISQSTGNNAIVFGELDVNGTLKKVFFRNKGSEYKYAEATIALPPVLANDDTTTVLRAVVSPPGGHGSNPIRELYMSKIGIFTNFFSDTLTNIPDSNTYTRVGLVKNPEFVANNFPDSLDNRVVATANGDVITGTVVQANSYITQTINGETLNARVHEVSYDANTNVTSIYIVDHDGSYSTSISAGTAQFRETENASSFDTVTINNVTDKKYIATTGDLLHVVSFDPVTRQADRKEKIKFVFDF